MKLSLIKAIKAIEYATNGKVIAIAQVNNNDEEFTFLLMGHTSYKNASFNKLYDLYKQDCRERKEANIPTASFDLWFNEIYLPFTLYPKYNNGKAGKPVIFNI